MASCSFLTTCTSTWSCRSLMLESSLLTFLRRLIPCNLTLISAQKLISNVNLQHNHVLWIADFFTNWCQQVFVNMLCSVQAATCIGYPPPPPKGESFPLLYILYTDNCRNNQWLCVWAADISLDRSLSSFRSLSWKIGMHETHLGLSGRPKPVLSYPIIFLRLSNLKAG